MNETTRELLGRTVTVRVTNGPTFGLGGGVNLQVLVADASEVRPFDSLGFVRSDDRRTFRALVPSGPYTSREVASNVSREEAIEALLARWVPRVDYAG